MAIKKSTTKERVKTKGDNDFEITKKIGKDLEKRLNGIEKDQKVIIKEILGNWLPKIKYKSKSQKSFVDSIINKNEKNDVIVATGSPGTGKSFLSIYAALTQLISPDNDYDCIWISTSVTPVPGEAIGYLKGSVSEKMEPFMYSTIYLFETLIGKSATNSLIDGGFIRVIPLAFLRGLNINGILILEEAQNTTIHIMKTILTRLSNAKFIISGDLKQSDRFKKSQLHLSGLYFINEKLKTLEGDGFSFHHFDDSEIVRNPLIPKMLKIFDEGEE